MQQTCILTQKSRAFEDIYKQSFVNMKHLHDLAVSKR